ncbi:MAG: PH domain-containing protein [Leucobacter sp.]
MTPRRPNPSQLSAEVDPLLAPAPANQRPETVVLRLRRHARRLTLPVLLLLGAAAAAGYWVGTLPEAWMNVAAGAGATGIVLLLVLLPLFAWLAQRTTVTTRRVILRRGFFVRHRTEVALSRVREVRSRRGLIQRMFGSGDIELLVGSEVTVLRDVPGVEEVVDALQDLMERNYASSMAQQFLTQQAMSQQLMSQQQASQQLGGTAGVYPGTFLNGNPR